MNKAEQLIACLEGEIAKRDARIVELELTVFQLNNSVTSHHWENTALRAELAAFKAQEPVAWAGVIEDCASLFVTEPQLWKAIPLYAAPVSEAKAQGVVMPERWNVPRPMWKDARQPYGNPLNHADIEAAEKFNLALDEVARLNASPVQQVSVPDVSAMARILADRNADSCNVNREDNWTIYGQDYIDDVTAMLAAAPAAPAADAGLTASKWTKDAEEWGGALNYAAWEFINECPEKSALLFNNTKGPLRAAIMKYAELVAASAKEPSHD